MTQKQKVRQKTYSITVSQYHVKYIDDHDIALSRFIRKQLDQRMRDEGLEDDMHD